jgi:hypothetical protein
MSPANITRALLSSTTLLVFAVGAQAGPSGVTTTPEVPDPMPVLIEMPADMLTLDSIDLDKAPQLDFDKLETIDVDTLTEGLEPHAFDDTVNLEPLDTEVNWGTESFDMDIDLPQIEVDNVPFDDIETDTGLNLDRPAGSAISAPGAGM